jgi:hypothetical protein
MGFYVEIRKSGKKSPAEAQRKSDLVGVKMEVTKAALNLLSRTFIRSSLRLCLSARESLHSFSFLIRGDRGKEAEAAVIPG